MSTQPRELRADFEFATPDGEFTVQIGATEAPVTISEYLPEMRALDDAIIQLVVERQERIGEPISCRKGCDACCRHLVPVSPAEAIRLARVVEEMPVERRQQVLERIAVINEAVESIGLGERIRAGYKEAVEAQQWVAEYFALQLPCPFLDNGACGIYEERPFACREYLVTSPAEECRVHASERLEKVFVPIHMRAVMERACVAAGADRKVIPLPWLVAWAAEHPEVAAARFPGVPMMTSLLQDLDTSCRRLTEQFCGPPPDRDEGADAAEPSATR